MKEPRSGSPPLLAPRLVLYAAVGAAFLILPMAASVDLIWEFFSAALALVFQVAAWRGLWRWYREYVDEYSHGGQL